ncbi:MAG: chorismate synthase, partial [Firmicutes bacterium]|nr:chorismate synthase [Bacillota bacterium]
MSNTFGKAIRITLFGESHGPAVGAVVDGLPPGLKIDTDRIKTELKRRSGIEGIST